MTNQILPLIIAIIMTFCNKSALVEQVKLQRYQQENMIDTRYITVATKRPKTKLPKGSRLVRYYKFTDGNSNRLIFGIIYADSIYVYETSVPHYLKGTYDQDVRMQQRKKTDEILNDYCSFRVYTADNKKFYMERKELNE